MKNPKKATEFDYEVLVKTWIGPHLKEKGDQLSMTEAQAKYYVMNGILARKKPEDKATPPKPNKQKS